MNKKLLIWITACFVASIGVVVLLVAASEDLRQKPGSFLREYPPHPIVEIASTTIDHPSYYIAGVTASHIYLSNHLAPLHLLKLNEKLTDTAHIRLKISGIEKQKYHRITVRIDSPYFHFMDGSIPYVYSGLIENWQGFQIPLDTTYFIDAIPITNESMIMRTTSARTLEHVLGKKVRGRKAKLNYDLLEKQFDGVFCTDGKLLYNHDILRLIYVYYYRNQFIVTDTSLVIDYRGYTIDTIKTAQVESAPIVSEGALRLSSPPRVTNRLHTTYKEWLFINSTLPARNENMKRFNEASVIDVYNLLSGDYQFSFHIYNRDGKKPKGFAIKNNYLYALFDNSLVVYTLTPYLFDSRLSMPMKILK
jgi:hypothetical protein